MAPRANQLTAPKVKFSRSEDDKLVSLIERLGTRDWETIAIEMKNRTPRQCRDRWYNYLNPNITNQPWSEEEDKLLEKMHNKYGSRWTKIARYFKNRSANGVRNRFRLKARKLKDSGIELVARSPLPATPAAPQLEEDVTQQFLNLFEFARPEFEMLFGVDSISFL